MDIEESAHKHGVADEDIKHAWVNALKVEVVEYNGGEQIFVIGPNRAGDLLELVAVPADTPVRIIHADRLRPSQRHRL